MIRNLIYKLNDWYNSHGSWTQMAILFGFCLTFLLLLWLAIHYVRFDADTYSTRVPGHIGQASGPAMIDTLKHQTH